MQKPSLTPRRRSHRILILAVAPAQLLDIAGPAEVLNQAGLMKALEGQPSTARDEPLYHIDLHIVTEPGTPETSSGIKLQSSLSRGDLLAGAAYDTLIVAGGEGARRRCDEPEIIELIALLAARSARVCGVCTGTFLLAEAGILTGRRVTTHWRWSSTLAERYEGIEVDPDPIYIQDNKVWTSAGITAGMDLTLALVEEDHGHALALAVARQLVLFLRRPGDQKQFSAVLSAQSAGSSRLSDLLAWMSENLNRNLSVPELADKACLSPRQFARTFLNETGMTPARMVERMRVEAARRSLEDGGLCMSAVAIACGFQTEETMRRSFLRHIGVPPSDYRARFRRSFGIHPGTISTTEGNIQ